MTTSARLEPAEASVLPGEEARAGLELRNSGEIVEAYSFEVLGEAAEFTTVDPPTLSLYPGTTGQVAVVFRPPSEVALSAGPVPYAVRVLPQEQPQHATVPEGVVHLLPVDRVDAELTPRMSQGRGGARHRIAIDNRGNQPVAATLSGSDRGELLEFSFPPGPTVTEPGRATFVQARIRPKRRIWRGQAVPHAFQVVVAPEAGEPTTLDGTYLQQPVLPKGLLKAAVAALAVVALLAGLWFGLLRPAVRSAAKDAVKDPVQAAASQASEAQKKASGAEAAAAAAQKAAGISPAAAPPPPATTGAAPAPGPGATLFSQRLRATPKAGQDGTDTYTVPDGKTLRLTDLVLENPQGDTGAITIAVDDKPLLSPALENFREQDFHWASAIVVSAKQRVTLKVSCQQVGHPPTGPTPPTCSAAALLSGSLE